MKMKSQVVVAGIIVMVLGCFAFAVSQISRRRQIMVPEQIFGTPATLPGGYEETLTLNISLEGWLPYELNIANVDYILGSSGENLTDPNGLDVPLINRLGSGRDAEGYHLDFTSTDPGTYELALWGYHAGEPENTTKPDVIQINIFKFNQQQETYYPFENALLVAASFWALGAVVSFFGLWRKKELKG